VNEIRQVKSRLRQRQARRAVWTAIVLPLLLGALTPLRGQEAVRMSLAGAQAAQARHRAISTPGYYNLEAGPTSWTFGTGLSVQYNSNVNLVETNRESDFILTPQINTRMFWPVSDKNSINLSLGVGYSAYLQHSELDRLFISPSQGSELSFDFYVGDFWINLHDRFSISEAPYQDPSVANSGNYSTFQNAVGVATTWDLNKVILKAGYDHVDNIPIQGGQSQQTLSEEVFSLSAGYMLKPQMLLGLASGVSLLNQGNAGTNTSFGSVGNGVQWNVGPFFETQASDYIRVSASAGYTAFVPESGGNVNSGDLSGMYGQLGLTHRLNRYVSYSLSGGRNFSVSLYGGATDMYFVNLGASWNLIQKVGLSTAFQYYHGTSPGYNSAGSSGETYDQYGPQVTLSRSLTKKLSSSLGFQSYWRDSNQQDRNYTVYVVTLSLNYTF
jgi:hypothetical protein